MSLLGQRVAVPQSRGVCPSLRECV
jgi:hypothetical protein